jgi:hypothetical protein
MHTWSFLGLSLLSLSACVSSRSVALGVGAPPRPDDCSLSYERADPAQVGAQWRQVGTVCVAGGDAPQIDVSDVYEPGEAKDTLSARACQLGAEMVSPVGLCSNGRQQGIEFGAYVKR